MENDNNILNETELENTMPEEPVAEEEIGEEQPTIGAGLAEKLEKFRDACKDTAERIKRDLKETDGNPYIRATSTYRYDIYRSADDTDPIDSFSIERSNGCTLRALALATGLVIAADVAIKSHFWRKK